MGYNSGMSFIDLHAHLDDQAFLEDRDRIVESFFDQGWYALVTVADAYAADSLSLTSDLLARHPRLVATAGCHPHAAVNYSRSVEDSLLKFVADHSLLACGEIGLDFHYNFSPPDAQRAVFSRQLALARDLNLPVIIHARNSEAEVLQTLERERFSNQVVFHCFSGEQAEADEIIARGYGLSISGIVTFQKAEALRAIVRTIPRDQVFTETDAPYLAPAPMRGRRNSPLLVDRVAGCVAECLGLEVAELNARVAANLERFFPAWKALCSRAK